LVILEGSEMPDPRFFQNAGPFRLGDLARAIDTPVAIAEADRIVQDVAPLDVAGANDLSFLDNRKYATAFAASAAGACIVHPEMVGAAPRGMALLTTTEPYRAYARIAALFYPTPAPEAGISPMATLHPTARVAPTARIEPGAVIGAHARIGERTVIGANTLIGNGVEVGADGVIAANVTIANALIGDRVILHPGVRVGQDGFGFAMGASGHMKVPQLGRVIIEDDVEIGANTTVDRGAGPDTIIGAGTKIDNLVQIAHNVRIGRFCVITAQVGISGSTDIDDFVVIGGQAGITGHLHIGAGARIAAQSGVMRDVPPRQTVAGSPAVGRIEWLRQSAILNRMGQEHAPNGAQQGRSSPAGEQSNERVSSA
jgi:UDP-3-O-[3-hydroxymyristoyl] glucosamine N-acyltransferase